MKINNGEQSEAKFFFEKTALKRAILIGKALIGMKKEEKEGHC